MNSRSAGGTGERWANFVCHEDTGGASGTRGGVLGFPGTRGVAQVFYLCEHSELEADS